MKRTKGVSAFKALALSILLTVSAAAQQPQKTAAHVKKSSGPIIRQSVPAQSTVYRGSTAYRRSSAYTRTYAPRIKGRSSSVVIEGLIARLEDALIVIKTGRGERHSFVLDERTSVISSDGLVSIATMADIALSASDLRVSDRVEVVTERVGGGDFARIITRIESSGAQVAKR